MTDNLDRRTKRLLEWLEKQRQDHADMVTDAGDASLWSKDEAEKIRDHIQTVIDMNEMLIELDFLRHEGGPQSVGAMEKCLREVCLPALRSSAEDLFRCVSVRNDPASVSGSDWRDIAPDMDEFGAQLDAHPAPDTQAPERIDTSRENIERIYWLVAESKAGREVRTEALRLITALSAERDLASAKTAAAVMRMREDALARITPAARGWPDACTNAALAAAAREIKALPLPDTTALDALIAERVREAVDRVSKLFEGCASRLVPADYAQGYREALDHVCDAARGSKEGQS